MPCETACTVGGGGGCPLLPTCQQQSAAGNARHPRRWRRRRRRCKRARGRGCRVSAHLLIMPTEPRRRRPHPAYRAATANKDWSTARVRAPGELAVACRSSVAQMLSVSYLQLDASATRHIIFWRDPVKNNTSIRHDKPE